jgi:flagellar biosynthesis/type III secretory pathway chaperone
MSRPATNPATLRRILQEELQLGNRMVTLAEAETEAIIANDIVRLNALEAELHRCVKQQSAQEKARIAVTRELAGMLGLERVPTLLDLLPLLPPREQEALQRLRAQLLETQETLQNLNQRNRVLLDHALEFVRFSLELLTTAVLRPARYGTNLASIAAPTFYLDSKA